MRNPLLGLPGIDPSDTALGSISGYTIQPQDRGRLLDPAIYGHRQGALESLAGEAHSAKLAVATGRNRPGKESLSATHLSHTTSPGNQGCVAAVVGKEASANSASTQLGKLAVRAPAASSLPRSAIWLMSVRLIST